MKKIIIVCTMFLLIIVSISDAFDVTLEWDKNEDADYYLVGWGVSSKSYDFISAKLYIPTTTYTVTDLKQLRYYFAVKAFNNCGNSSDWSQEISKDLNKSEAHPLSSCSGKLL